MKNSFTERESKMSKEEYEKMTTEISKFLENVLYVDDDSIPKENSISDATRSSEEGNNQSLSNVAKEVNAKPTLHFRQSTSPSRGSRPTMSLSSSMSATTVSANAEKDKLTKMKQRKEARKERAEKKIKTVTVEEDQEKPYDIEKILEALGEVNYLVIYLIFINFCNACLQSLNFPNFYRMHPKKEALVKVKERSPRNNQKEILMKLKKILLPRKWVLLN